MAAVNPSRQEAADERQGKGRARIDRRLGRARGGEGHRWPLDRLAGDPVGGRPFADRPLGDGADLFRGAALRQAGRRGTPIRARQGRERHRACRNGAAVPALGHRDLGGGAAADRRAGARGRSDRRGLRHHRRLHRGRFLPRPHAAPRRRGDLQRSARSRRAAFRLRHVVVGRGAGRALRRRARLCVGRCHGGDRGRGFHLHCRLAARPAHHRHA